MIKQRHSSESHTAAHDLNTVRLTSAKLNSMSVSVHSGVLLLADAERLFQQHLPPSLFQVPALHTVLPLRQEDTGTMFPCRGGARHRRHISPKSALFFPVRNLILWCTSANLATAMVIGRVFLGTIDEQQ